MEAPRRSRSLHPERVGRYRILEPLAQGGMATVYLGSADGLAGFERRVAIKTLHPHLSTDREFVAMFLDEARLAARIRHPNVVSVSEVGQDDELLFIAMDYVSGLSLAEVLKAAGRMPFGLAAQLIAVACEALHAAHQLRGPDGDPLRVVHRDISPENLLLSFDGVLRVTDFGVAKSCGQLAATVPGTRKGKIAYMSPEQLRGGVLDHRSDIFALGVVLWEATLGCRLFGHSTPIQSIEQILNGAITRPRDVDPDFPTRLEDIILTALAQRREDRFESAREMATALQRFLVTRGERVGPWDAERFLREQCAAEREARLELEQRAQGAEARTLIAPPPLPPRARQAPVTFVMRTRSAPKSVPPAAKSTPRLQSSLLAIAIAVLFVVLTAWLSPGPQRAGDDAPPAGAMVLPDVVITLSGP